MGKEILKNYEGDVTRLLAPQVRKKAAVRAGTIGGAYGPYFGFSTAMQKHGQHLTGKLSRWRPARSLSNM
jgi:hypothetical protein